MKRLVLMAVALILAGCSKPVEPAKTAIASDAPASFDAFPPPSVAGLPAGDYRIDPEHASLTFKVNHMGFSHYTARFFTFDADLKLDPAHPDAANLVAHIDPKSLTLNAPPKGFHDQLMGKMFFETDKYPTMGFSSTRIEKTGAFTARVTGDLTLHGVTRPVTLDVAFNGGYPGMSLDPNARIGFTANGTLKRSDFGMGMGIPAPGSHLGLADEVAFTIDAEFKGPPLTSATPARAL